MRVSYSEVTGSATSLSKLATNGPVLVDVVGADARVVLPDDVLQVAISATLITRHFYLWILNLTCVGQFVGRWPR